jgi:hypothetical protein
MAISRDVVEEEDEVPLVEELPLLDATTLLANPLDIEPLISLHELMGLYCS